MKRVFLLTVFVGFIPFCQDESVADTIRVGNETHENVYVIEDQGEYSILFPATGETLSVSSKRTDVELVEKSDETLRQQLHQQWTSRKNMREAAEEEESASDTTGDGVPQPTDKAPAVITNATIAESGSARDTAEFETQLMLWAQLDAVVRERLFNEAAARARSDVLFNMGRVRAMQEVREENEEAIQQDVERFEEVADEAAAAANEAQAQAAEELARAQSQAGWNYLRGGIRNRVVIDDTDVVAGNVTSGLISPGRLSLGNIYWDPASQGLNPAEEDVAAGAALESEARAGALAAEAADIADSVEEAAAQTEARVDQLQAQNEEIAVEQTRMIIETEDALTRAQAQLARMQQLEDAFLGGYELSIPFVTVRELSLPADAAEASMDVEVTAPLWRVLWAVSGPTQTSQGFLISVSDVEGKPVGGSGDSFSPYGRFLLLDGPGKFTVHMRGAAGSRCVVVVEEAENLELPEPEVPAPANPAESPARAGS